MNVTPLVILSRSRTGSNLLVSLMNSHPAVSMRGEIFSSIERGYQEILESAFLTPGPKKRVAGFKLFYYHARSDGSEGLWGALAQRADLRVLHLKRRNALRAIVSRELAAQHDEWRVRKGEYRKGREKSPVYLDPQEVVSQLEETRTWEEWGDRFFSKHSTLDVYYEDLVADKLRECGRIFGWLQLDTVDVSSDLQKQNPESLSDLVANYRELAQVLESTPWGYMLDQDS